MTYCLLSLFITMAAAEPKVITLPDNFPLFEKLNRAEKANRTSVRVKAISCLSPTLLGTSLASVSRSIASPGTLSFQIDQKSYYIKDVLAFIRFTPSGKFALDIFMPQFQAGTIKIEQMTNMGESRCGRNPAACYVPEKQTIYVDKSVELGLLAPVLMHEIVHSIDGDIRKIDAKLNEINQKLGAEMKAIIHRVVESTKREALALTENDFTNDDIESLWKIKVQSFQMAQIQMFRSERLAYDWGERTTQELLQLFPQFYQAHPIPSQKRSDNEIIEGYQLDKLIIEKYLSGACNEG